MNIIKDIFTGLLGGFLGSLIFIPIMLLAPNTLFMQIMMILMPNMSGANILGWILHAVINSVWGLLFVLILRKIKTKKIYATSLAWSLLLGGIIINLAPSFGIQVTTVLLVVEGIAYINYSIILWAVYPRLSK